MRYDDFTRQEQEIIDEFLEKVSEIYDDGFYSDPYNLDDDELFFQTEDQIRDVIGRWMDSPGSYGSLARELDAYLDEPPAIGEIRELEWACVMPAENSTFLFMSNSWSDSGLFLNR